MQHTLLVFLQISNIGIWDIDAAPPPWMLVAQRRHIKFIFNLHCHHLEFHQLNVNFHPWGQHCFDDKRGPNVRDP